MYKPSDVEILDAFDDYWQYAHAIRLHPQKHPPTKAKYQEKQKVLAKAVKKK